MAQYQRHYVELGAGPYVAKRVAHEDGTFSLSFGEGETVIGRGNTREDAARHLAELRELARLVEALEGVR